jgi:hypothetical protein
MFEEYVVAFLKANGDLQYKLQHAFGVLVNKMLHAPDFPKKGFFRHLQQWINVVIRPGPGSRSPVPPVLCPNI